jgi:rRNA biogenesis protein RRP5
MTKMKELTSQMPFWLNYATFLLTTRNNADSARALLMRAMQSVPESEHRNLTAKFGALEFTSPNGDTERGRTVFEGLLSTWPKRTELWDMYVDLERSQGGEENVRQLYERMAKMKMKKRRAKFVFKKWLEFEERVGGKGKVDHVTTLATAYVKKLQTEGDPEEE